MSAKKCATCGNLQSSSNLGAYESFGRVFWVVPSQGSPLEAALGDTLPGPLLTVNMKGEMLYLVVFHLAI